MNNSQKTIAILDFGSQYTQLIARRLREAHIYCEVFPYTVDASGLASDAVAGIILSGGPASVTETKAPVPDPFVFSGAKPVLGICYGLQLLAHRFGGYIASSDHRREYGPARIQCLSDDPLFKGIRNKNDVLVWMSHGDHLETPPKGFRVIAKSGSIPIAAVADHDRKMWGVQFHPEVKHTRGGARMLRNFAVQICGCKRNWTEEKFIDQTIKNIRRQIRNGKVICGLSGGLDSAVVTMLLDRAVPEQLVAVFIDNGILRAGEAESVVSYFKPLLKDRFIAVDAGKRFLAALAGVSDPEKKRKIIGETFIRVFEETAENIGDIRFLAQGTLYPDIIESISVKGPSATIKTHHNVGGLPEKMDLELVEPLRTLFKDEVRDVGRRLGLPDHIIYRQPFPGPGLAVRILGEVTPERIRIIQAADKIVREELAQAGLMKKIWQAFAVLLPIRSVGVMGDRRTYEQVCAVRAVQSADAMTADWSRIPYAVLATISNRIANEVPGINRVVYDISSKPPATIEWE